MKKTLLALSAALALTACAPGAITPTIPTPAAYAQRTAADEQIAVGLEQGYKAFRLALELGADTGVIKGERARVAAAADERAYAALLTARVAYTTANASDYISLARNANATIAAAIAAVRSK